MKQSFDVGGMTCAACSAHVEKATRKAQGVADVAVNLLKNSMEVEYAADVTPADIDRINEQICANVEKGGYTAKPRTADSAGVSPEGKNSARTAREQQAKASEAQERHMRMRLIVSIIFCVPLFYIAMGGMFGWPLPEALSAHSNPAALALSELLLVAPIVFVDFKFFSSGFKSLVHLAPNMDALIAIGATASLGYSIYQSYVIAFSEEATEKAMSLYFDSAGMILTLITLGKYFEARAKGKTTDAISKLIDLSPKTANVLKGQDEVETPIEQVRVGDILVVRAGQTVPLDGTVLTGSASIDESAITGESVPVDKEAGDAVTGATISRSGYFTMEVTKTGDDTVLAGIIALVDQATSSKAPIQNTADKIAGIFVPAVIGIALLAFIVWMAVGTGVQTALNHAISVLVISCPCALGLAAPTAVMVGTGRGAREGILIKSAESFELAGRAKTVVFDKTGTITKGSPSVTCAIPASGSSLNELLGLALSLEGMSEHPLAKAITAYAEDQGAKALDEVEDFTQVPGQGLSGKLGGKTALAGNLAMMESRGIDTQALSAKAKELADGGATPLFFSLDGQLIGLVATSDEIKPSSPGAISELKAMGIDTVMLTGDNERTAKAIMGKAGVNRMLAGVLPADKEREIARLSESGSVLMVGDGVNDAPALARADVGIAIGNGTDIAIDSADMVLMKNDLIDVASAVKLSRKTLLTIKQNLFWALIYNVICIPIAAGVFSFAGLNINPMIGAAAMGCSSIFVVGNALRMRTWKPGFITGAQTSRMQADSNSEKPSPPPAIETSGAGAEVKTQAGTLCPLDIMQDAECDKATTAKGELMEKTITVDGMMCSKCEGHVKKALEALDGVESALADHEKGQVTMQLSKDVDDAAIAAAIEEAGYEAKL